MQAKKCKFLSKKTLNAAYQKLRILDTSRYDTSNEFKEVFQSMSSEHTMYIIFDSAFIEKDAPLPLPPIEAMHSLAILKQNRSASMQNDDRVEKKTTHPRDLFSLCVWSRKAILSLSMQEKEKKIERIINNLDNMLLSLMQQSKTGLQIHHYPNTCAFTPRTRPTFYQHPAPPPLHLMLPPGPLVPSFSQPCYMSPFAASIQPYATPPQFTGPHFTKFYAIPPLLPPLSFAPPQTTEDLISYLENAISRSSTQNEPHNAEQKVLHQTMCPFLQQVYKIGSFTIPIRDAKYVRNACMKQFGYITFNDYTHSEYYFLSNIFFCKTSFSIDHQKTQWISAFAFISAKKLDYFNPPLSTKIKETVCAELKKI